MKKHLFIPVILMVLLASCKKQGTTNNITNNNNNVINNQTPAFLVEGITNFTMTNFGVSNYPMYITVNYGDSTQQVVTLALSGLPAGIAIDTTWLTSGYPTFNTTLTFYDTTAAGVTPGAYPLTITAIGSISGTKTFPFTLTIKNPPPCTSILTGKYINCNSCTSFTAYTDSVYADATTQNKIWFTNFYNTGAHVYGLLNCNTGLITIPTQTVGSNTYSGNGDFGTHYIYLGGLMINSSSCSIYEN